MNQPVFHEEKLFPQIPVAMGVLTSRVKSLQKDWEKNILVHAPGICWYTSGVFSVSQNVTLPETEIVPEDRPKPKRKG